MRATFIPCSASGIAQPRITSSISAGAIAGVRRKASAMATAASSSGRVPRSVPFGAFPTGVRTAETITASFICRSSSRRGEAGLGPSQVSAIPVSQQLLNGVPDFADLAIEQVVGGVDDDELLGFGCTRIEFAHVLQRADLVALAVDEELRLRRLRHRLEVVAGDWRRDGDQRRHARV